MRRKARVTITLPHSVLRSVDKLVASSSLSNRSFAIEQLLKQSLKPKFATAAFLAGGRSTKQLAPFKKIHGQYAFALMVKQIKNYGLTRIIVCLPKERHGQFVQAFGHGEGFGVDIEYSVESKQLGTAGALKKAQDLLRSEPFLVMHGDVLTNINFQDFIQFHNREDVPATIAVKPRLGERKYGQIFMQGNKIVKFLKVGTDKGISIINTGMYVLNPSIFSMIPSNQYSLLEKDVFPVLAERGRLSAFIFQGQWFDLSNPDQLKLAEKNWND